VSWKAFTTRLEARRYAEAKPLVDDIDVTFDQPGWYWCEMVEEYRGNCWTARTCRVISAARRAGELREQIAELDAELKETIQKIENAT
jgi:hypothetical protein